MTARIATALVMVAAALGAPAAALADGDPASDVLLLRDVYLPYAPPPAPAAAKALEALLAKLRREHYPMKVALIEARGDLGAYPELYGEAPQYAKLLEQEISFKVRKPRLLIVMQGTALVGRNLGPRAGAILPAITADPAARSDGLVKAATEAVAKLAAAAGHPVSVPKPRATKAHGTSHTALYVVAALVVLAGIGLIAVSVRRPRSA